MLIANENILQHFKKRLAWAKKIDLATAWATSDEGLRARQRQTPNIEVRAVVGLWGHLTDPFALKMLAGIGELRAVEAHRRVSPVIWSASSSGVSRWKCPTLAVSPARRRHPMANVHELLESWDRGRNAPAVHRARRSMTLSPIEWTGALSGRVGVVSLVG